ncbi:MAG: diacylglycerol kinase family protein [Planctomycetota bacterium]
MRRRFLAIVNPVSGPRDMIPLVRRIESALAKQGASLETMVTERKGDAKEMARSASRQADAVLVVGGDGTVCEVVNGLMGQGVPFLILGTGTENLLAREFAMPTNPESVADRLLEGRPVPCDVGEVNGKRFLAMVGVGFDAECLARMSRVRRGHINHLDYFWPIWRTFWSHRFPRLRVRVDGADVFQGRGMVFIGGISKYAAGLRILARAQMDDGLLDVCVLPCEDKVRFLHRAMQLFMHRHLAEKQTVYVQGRAVQVESCDPDVEVPFQADGDWGGKLPIHCKIFPAAVMALR